jgi:hypothetical protein
MLYRGYKRVQTPTGGVVVLLRGHLFLYGSVFRMSVSLQALYILM